MKETIIENKSIVKSALDIMGISIDAYAYSIDRDRSVVYRYLSGESKVPFEVLSNILDLLYDHGIDIVKVLGIEEEDAYYYHATSSKILFPINVHINDGGSRDFGYGFYLGENLRQSSTWGKLGSSTIIYRFKRDQFEGLSTLDFNLLKPIDWLNFVAINRKKIAFEDYPSLFRKYFGMVEGKDMVKGKIADSFSYEVLELLYKDKLDIDQAEYATKIMALGNQYCLKNDTFAKNLTPDEMISYDETLSRYFLHCADRIQQKQNKNIELIIKNPPKKDRLFSAYLKRHE